MKLARPNKSRMPTQQIAVIGLLLLASLLTPLLATADTRLKIGTFEVGEKFPRNRAAPEVIARAALSDNHLDMELVFMPATRSLLQANQGLVDGELIRSENSVGNHIGTLAVPEPLCAVDYYLYGLPPATASNYWSDLPDPHLIVLANLHELSRLLPPSLTTAPPLAVQNVRQGVRSLLSDQGNLLLMPEGLVEIAQATDPTQTRNIIKLHPRIARQPGYLWLHQRHQNLIPAIAASIKQLKTAYKEAHHLDDTQEIGCGEILEPGEFRDYRLRVQQQAASQQ